MEMVAVYLHTLENGLFLLGKMDRFSPSNAPEYLFQGNDGYFYECDENGNIIIPGLKMREDENEPSKEEDAYVYRLIGPDRPSS